MAVDLTELQALRLASNTRLLVVDDEPRVVASLEVLLKHKHYQVDTALGGKLACQQLEQNHYDVVLLDLNMGNFDGFAVIAFMADQGIDAAIVVVSGESTFDAVRKALRMGASDYVKKPYSPEELFATIDLALHKNTWRIDGRVAKARLQAKDTTAAELSMVDAQKLLHELEVHQIELEMQNESLLEARDAEQLALHRYTELFDFAPIGYLILDPTSKITQVNLKATHLLGIERSNLSDRRFLVYIALEYRLIFCDFLENVFVLGDKQNCEILVQVGKHDLWLSLEANIGASATECLVAMVDISERKQAEEELRQNNTLFSQAEGMGNMGHFSWDLSKDKLISCSDQFARIYDMTVSEALDYFTSTEVELDLVHPDDKGIARLAEYDTLGRFKEFDVGYRIITLSGNTRHIQVHSQFMFDNDGVPLQSFGIVQDITESKQIKELLQKSNERFEISQKFSNTGSWEWDIKSGDLYWSRMISKMFGGQEGALSTNNENFISAIHPDDRQLVQDSVNSCIEDDKDYNLEYRVVWPDRTIHWLSDQGNIVRNNLGEAERMFGLVQDITERKQAEMKLERAASVFTNADESIMITDANGTLTEVNDAFCRVTGYTPFDVLGKNPRMLKSDRHPPEFYEDMWDTIITKDHWCGEIWNRRKNGEVYAEKMTISAIKNTEGFVHHYVSLATDITQIKAYQDQLERMAHYDPLTALPNRVLLVDRINQGMVQFQRRNLSLAVAYLDLDGFKIVNDTHGHHLGDELLIAISQRMKEALREVDTLARIGGDEFVAVMVDLERIEDSEPLLKRLLKAATEPVIVGDVVMQVSASIGVTLYPQDGVDADQLMRHADQAMYTAKQAGRNRYQLFDVAQDTAINIQQQSIVDIRSALDRHEFVLHYQPKVNMHTSEVIGVEALIRWQHPDRGLVPPLDFLPVVEGHSISLELGEWVISTVLSQINQWRSMDVNLPISVNISAYQLQQDNFTTRLTTLLASHPDVNPHYLELEILETSVLSDINQVLGTMNACHDLGVRFALDDFGTGYSSLTHLRRLPAHLIKIDQSFVRDMLEDADDLAIIESVIALAKTFKREVIAEGVETIEHGVALLQLGCELAQGFGIARPMPSDDIPRWISSWKADDSWQAKSPIE